MNKFLILLLLIFFGANQQMNGQQKEPRKLFPIQTKSGTGFIDRKGNVIIDPIKIEELKERFAALVDKDTYLSRMGFGVHIEDFSEGLAVISWATCPGCRWHRPVYGFVDERGKIVIQPENQSRHYKSFHEGFALFWDRGYGFIDHTGKEVITAQFYKASSFSDGLACVQEKENGRFGFINKKGKLVIPYQFKMVSDFHEGFAVVKTSDGKSGYIDKTGRIIFHSNEWKDVKNFSEGLAAIRTEVTNNRLYQGYKEQLYGYIDSTGKFVIEPQFNAAFEFSEGKAVFIQTGQNYGYGFIDRKGQIVIQPIYKAAKNFSEGLAAVAIGSNSGNDKLWGYINTKGEWVIKPQYKYVASFSGGLAGVDCDEYERYCKTYIDKKGRVVWQQSELK